MRIQVLDFNVIAINVTGGSLTLGFSFVRALWNPKSGKFEPRKWPVEDEYQHKRDKAA
jgi:hypothetical protein